MPTLPAIVKGCLRVIVIGALCLFALGQYLHLRRERVAYRTLSETCADNTARLADFLKEYQAEHGEFPSDLEDLIPLASNRRWLFSCALVNNPKVETLVSPLPIRQVVTVSLPTRITYLYFTNALQGIRLICPAWHERLTAVDAAGNVIQVNREKWEALKQALAGREYLTFE